MEKDPTLSSVSDILMKIVIDPDNEQFMSDDEKQKALHEADRLHAHWLVRALKHTKKASLTLLVRVSQKFTVYLLNELFDRYTKRRSIFKKNLEKSLFRFLYYLKTEHPDYFDFNAAIPKSEWMHMQQRIMEILMPEEGQGMEDVDVELVDLIHKQYHMRIGEHTATFAQAFYWQTLTDRFHETLAVNEATLQTIYTLIAYNFNCYAFIEYVIHFYGEELPPDEDATDFWRAHLLLLRKIELPDIPNLALDPHLPHCRKMLFKAIKTEMQTFVYTNEINKLNSAPLTMKTMLTGSLLSLLYRLQVEVDMLDEQIIIELMRKIALLHETPGGSRSPYYLKNMYHSPEMNDILKMENYLAKMTKRLNEIKRGKP